MHNYFFKAKNYIENLGLYVASPHNLQTHQPIAYFDLNGVTNRYTYNLIKLLQLAGYSILLKHRFLFLANIHEYGKKIFSLSNLKLTFSDPPGGSLLISDHLAKCSLCKGQSIFIDYNCFAKHHTKSNTITFTFMMHPMMYDPQKYSSIFTNRHQLRKARVAFLGNSKEDVYKQGAQYIRSVFHKIPRYQLIQYLKDHLPTEAQDRFIPEDSDEYLNKFVMTDRVNFTDWLKTLAKADFFLSPCGVFMPLSHNIIEAMAVGTIPITEYPELFDPPLTNGTHCIAYQTKEGAVDAIHKALSMTEEEVRTMRAEVLQYYDTYLNPEKFGERIAQLTDASAVLLFNAEKHSVDLFVQEFKLN